MLTARQWQALAQASGRAMDRLYDVVSRLTMCLGGHVANANPRERDLLGQRVAREEISYAPG